MSTALDEAVKKAEEVQRHRDKWRTCIRNDICPQCGGHLKTAEWNEMFCDYWKKCHNCTHDETERYGFLWLRRRVVKRPDLFI